MSNIDKLMNKKIKDLINMAKSELSDYNNQKVLKKQSECDTRIIKILKKIVDLQNPQKIDSSKIDERLKEAIKKAKPNMDKIKDVDKFLDDIR